MQNDHYLMRGRRKALQIFFLLAFAFFCLTPLGAQAEEKEWSIVRIGTEGAYPPFNVLNPDGSLTGFDIAIAHALCAQMKVKCVLSVQEWEGMIPALLSGKFDAVIASMEPTEERRKKIDFTDPYYISPIAVVVPKDSPLMKLDLKALEGLRIGVQASTSHAEFVRTRLKKAKLKLYPTAEEYKLDIENGRLDAVIDSRIVIAYWLSHQENPCCRILGLLSEGEETVDVSIALRKEDIKLKQMFNEALSELKKDGRYERLRKEHLSF